MFDLANRNFLENGLSLCIGFEIPANFGCMWPFLEAVNFALAGPGASAEAAGGEL